MELVGLIPAAGRATRLGTLPCSKEILPLKLGGAGAGPIYEVFADRLLSYYRTASIRKVFFLLRSGKWDIPAYFGNGHERDMHFSYQIVQHLYGIPFSLREAYPFVKDSAVALGFPDMVVQPVDCFRQLYARFNECKSHVVLGIFPVKTPEKWDMVRFAEDGKIGEILIKEPNRGLKYGWSIALWGPEFSEFLFDYTGKIIAEGSDGMIALQDGRRRELYPGDLFMRSIREGLKVDYLIFDRGSCTDLGTITDLSTYMSSAPDSGNFEDTNESQDR